MNKRIKLKKLKQEFLEFFDEDEQEIYINIRGKIWNKRNRQRIGYKDHKVTETLGSVLVQLNPEIEPTIIKITWDEYMKLHG